MWLEQQKKIKRTNIFCIIYATQRAFLKCSIKTVFDVCVCVCVGVPERACEIDAFDERWLMDPTRNDAKNPVFQNVESRKVGRSHTRALCYSVEIKDGDYNQSKV